MKIDIILNEQTPRSNEIKNPKQWIKDNEELVQAIKDYLDTKSSAIGISSVQLSVFGNRCIELDKI